jgi:hypothetical protein
MDTRVLLIFHSHGPIHSLVLIRLSEAHPHSLSTPSSLDGTGASSEHQSILFLPMGVFVMHYQFMDLYHSGNSKQEITLQGFHLLAQYLHIDYGMPPYTISIC